MVITKDGRTAPLPRPSPRRRGGAIPGFLPLSASGRGPGGGVAFLPLSASGRGLGGGVCPQWSHESPRTRERRRVVASAPVRAGAALFHLGGFAALASPQ